VARRLLLPEGAKGKAKTKFPGSWLLPGGNHASRAALMKEKYHECIA
jgi:hypothetical protein